jgi:biotin operon repressor
VRAQDLAEGLGLEKQAFKNDVRKLKGLGLTISHSPGYELSPRGMALLRRLDELSE